MDFSGGAEVKNPAAKAGTEIQSLVLENPTCHWATKLLSLCSRAHVPQLLKSMHPGARVLQYEKPPNEKPEHCNWRVDPTPRNVREALAWQWKPSTG